MGKFRDKAQPVTEIDPYIRMFLYGPMGSGKTYLIGDAPKPLWFDFENSTDTLATSGNPKHKQAQVLKWGKDFKDFEQFCEALREVVADTNNNWCETVVLDSTTAMQALQMQEALLVQEGASAKVLGYKKEFAKDRVSSHYKAEIQDWGFSTNLLNEIFYVLNGLQKNLVLIGHDVTEKDELTGAINTRMALTPSLAGKVGSLVSVVGYLTVKKGLQGQDPKRKLIVNPYGREAAKNRLGVIHPEIEDPSWDKIYKLFTESRKK